MFRLRNLLTYLLIYLLTYSLTPWSGVLLEQLTCSQLVNKFPAFYGTRGFIAAYVRKTNKMHTLLNSLFHLIYPRHDANDYCIIRIVSATRLPLRCMV